MATRCRYCGISLTDDARFCNNCGMLIAPYPFSSRSQPSQASSLQAEQRGRELPVQVWESKEVGVVDMPTQELMSLVVNEADDLPTRPLVATSPGERNSADVPSVSPVRIQSIRTDDVALLDTVPHLAGLKVPSIAQEVKPTSQVSLQAAMVVPKGRRGQLLVVAMVIMVMLVLIGGLGAWIILFQPFSVPSVTQPEQSFRDSGLGISLLYPSSWVTQVDRNKATVHFYDSSHTGQINIIVGMNGGDPHQAVQQQASQLSMTAQKVGASPTFAGTIWQQVQGNVQQNGASYTATILVSMHNRRLYTLVFLAPQSIYAQEEQYVFARLRASFQFLS